MCVYICEPFYVHLLPSTLRPSCCVLTQASTLDSAGARPLPLRACLIGHMTRPTCGALGSLALWR